MKVRVTQLDGVNTMTALPLAAGLVVASARLDPAVAARANLDVVVGNDPVDRLVDNLGDPDVLGLSVYLWNARYSLEVARRAKERRPDSLVVAGGPAIPTRLDAAERYLRSHPQVDVLVLGEGEVTFRELLASRLDATDLRAVDGLHDIAGLAFREPDGSIVVTPARPRLTDFEGSASPFLDGTFDRLCERHPDRYPGPFGVALFESNRGCPFTCTFCSSGLDVHNRVYELPVERVQRELDWIVERGFPYLFITDLNFGIRPRDADIAEYLADLKGRTGFPGYCFFYTTKNARARHLAPVQKLLEAGIGCQVALSMQSFDEGVLEAVRRSNIPAERWLELRELCDASGITTYNELILGLPGQTYDSFATSVLRAVSPLTRDLFYIYLCRVLPNTEMDAPASRQRFALETRSCVAKPADARFEAPVDEVEEIVVGTATMPVAEWRRAYTFGYLVSACTNQRLLDRVVRYLAFVVELDMRAYFDHLRVRIDQAPDGTVLASMRRVFEAYFESILSGGPVLLPVEGAGQTHREVGEALVVTALERPGNFFDEIEAATSELLGELGHPTKTVAELLRLQRFATPSLGDAEPRMARFDHDWLPYWQGLGRAPEPPPGRATELLFEPPAYAESPTFQMFIQNHLAAVRLKADTGVIRAVS